MALNPSQQSRRRSQGSRQLMSSGSHPSAVLTASQPRQPHAMSTQNHGQKKVKASVTQKADGAPESKRAKLIVSICLSAMETGVRQRLTQQIKKLGGVVEKEPDKASHLVVGRVEPSVKSMVACARGIWVVSPKFIEMSSRYGRWLPEDEFELRATKLRQLLGVDQPSRDVRRTAEAFHHWRFRRDVCEASGKRWPGPFSGKKVALVADNDKNLKRYASILIAGRASLKPILLRTSSDLYSFKKRLKSSSTACIVLDSAFGSHVDPAVADIVQSLVKSQQQQHPPVISEKDIVKHLIEAYESFPDLLIKSIQGVRMPGSPEIQSSLESSQDQQRQNDQNFKLIPGMKDPARAAKAAFENVSRSIGLGPSNKAAGVAANATSSPSSSNGRSRYASSTSTGSGNASSRIRTPSNDATANTGSVPLTPWSPALDGRRASGGMQSPTTPVGNSPMTFASRRQSGSQQNDSSRSSPASTISPGISRRQSLTGTQPSSTASPGFTSPLNRSKLQEPAMSEYGAHQPSRSSRESDPANGQHRLPPSVADEHAKALNVVFETKQVSHGGPDRMESSVMAVDSKQPPSSSAPSTGHKGQVPLIPGSKLSEDNRFNVWESPALSVSSAQNDRHTLPCEDTADTADDQPIGVDELRSILERMKPATLQAPLSKQTQVVHQPKPYGKLLHPVVPGPAAQRIFAQQLMSTGHSSLNIRQYLLSSPEEQKTYVHTAEASIAGSMSRRVCPAPGLLASLLVAGVVEARSEKAKTSVMKTLMAIQNLHPLHRAAVPDPISSLLRPFCSESLRLPKTAVWNALPNLCALLRCRARIVAHLPQQSLPSSQSAPAAADAQAQSDGESGAPQLPDALQSAIADEVSLRRKLSWLACTSLAKREEFDSTDDARLSRDFVRECRAHPDYVRLGLSNLVDATLFVWRVLSDACEDDTSDIGAGQLLACSMADVRLLTETCCSLLKLASTDAAWDAAELLLKILSTCSEAMSGPAELRTFASTISSVLTGTDEMGPSQQNTLLGLLPSIRLRSLVSKELLQSETTNTLVPPWYRLMQPGIVTPQRMSELVPAKFNNYLFLLAPKFQPLQPAKPPHVNPKGETELHQAANAAKTAKCRQLVARGDWPNTVDNAGWSPIAEAASYGHTDVVKAILQHPHADCDVTGEDLYTALHYAAENADAACVAALLIAGADPARPGAWNKAQSAGSGESPRTTPLDIVLDRRDNELLDVIAKHCGYTANSAHSRRYRQFVARGGRLQTNQSEALVFRIFSCYLEAVLLGQVSSALDTELLVRHLQRLSGRQVPLSPQLNALIHVMQNAPLL